jgi:hypothetical protein
VDRDLEPGVICHSGQSACDHPQVVDWQGEHLAIIKIVKEWREPGSKHYLVDTSSGRQFNLTFLEASRRWLVSEVTIKS